ncbi:hypothetical protein KAFR_0H03660 [Kazachstania africana CBS 2517]|uniref:Amino acid transporter transmembrane domain-containing protein n=1 Tax=Kazachstania africana (strain ATCC 22294 / BCRC 22015 / CBS 2517 / CECT 1963 / NBRC 1671 / NRRL Y-8276) TaxID=1071382 RepID=H2AYJ9_KAZAF|nr:hypothetical protein KAFR_0H03660 [Kazachstania africana CBS 2517]CCF59776.1 hypothetical protein KAFR_0H03660 [Kazachstania africana CBS 2517]
MGEDNERKPVNVHINNNESNRSLSSRRSSTLASLKLPLVPSSENVMTFGSLRNSNSSMDFNNPDPQMVGAVARHLVKNSNDLQLQGGDMTRDLYKWTNEHPTTPLQRSNQNVPSSPVRNGNNDFRRRRSMSFSALSINSATLNNLVNPELNIPNDMPTVMMTHDEIRAPGGFRRSFIIHKHRKRKELPPNFITRNFIEFLTLYGHFAGEDLADSEVEEEEEYDEEEAIETETEASLLLTRTPSISSIRAAHKTSTFKAVLLLLKSFVGTGVLFLPKAFSNGGWGFSSLCLLMCAVLSYYCFILLIITKDKVGVAGYGDMGEVLYGSKMKLAILASIALSQIGFSAAYTVFTATNLQVFCQGALNLPDGSLGLGIFIVLQALIFIPLSLTRNIAKLSVTALLADLFILLGLIYVYYYAIYYVAKNSIATATMVWFNNSDWSLFIGTAIFTFEGIGLLIPIQESMRHPEKFQSSLFGVMCIVSVVFISCGLLCYSAFGSNVQTVVLLNFPQDSPYTLLVQLFYSMAILLSTPLQLFPAIRILEHWTFPSNASGKYNPKIKWRKNYFRCIIVVLTSVLAWVGASNLDKFVSLVGSLACIPLIYIHPPLLHFKAFKDDQDTRYWSLICDILLLAFGVGVMTYTSVQTLFV